MKNKLILLFLLLNFSGFSQITRTLSNVNNTADSLKPVSIAQQTAINYKLQSVLTIADLKIYNNSNFAYFDGSTWEKKNGNVVSNGGSFAGTIINVNTTSYWERKVENYVYPDWFGANTVNDDNSVQIQNAINYAIANNLSIKFGRKAGGTLGLFKITSPLTISNRISIIGDGTNYCGLFCINSHGFVINAGVNNVTIEGLSIIAGTRYTTTVHNYIAIQTLGLTTSQNYWHTYKDLFLDGFKYGLQIPNTWSSVFNNITTVFSYGGINAPAQSVNNFVSNCQFSGSNSVGSTGIQIGDGTIATEGWAITDCLISNFDVGVFIYGGSNITVRGNIIDFFSQRGIFLQSNAIAASMNCTISENYLATAVGGATGIWCLNDFAGSGSQNRGNVINSNQILFYTGGSLAYGIYVSGSAETKNIITGNRINATTFDLRVTTGANSVVANNSFKGGGFYGDIPVNYYGNTGTILSGTTSYYQSNGKNNIYYNSAIPTTGTYGVGDIVYNVSVTSSTYVGWICTTAGTPGTWTGFGLVNAGTSKLENVNSIAQLQAYILSNTANFDGNIWERKSGNIASNGGAFAGTIINVSASFYWERKFTNHVIADWFGVTADGITDNTTALQNAVNYASSSSLKKVLLPKGVIIITSPILIGNNTPNDWYMSIEGMGSDLDGRGTTIQNNGTGFAIISDLRLLSGGLRGITLKNFSIRGNSNLAISGSGIKLIRNQQSLIENVYFFNINKSIVVTGDSHYNIFRLCKTYNCNYGIKVPLDVLDTDFVVNNANNNIITGCWFDNCLVSPLYLGDADSWTIENTDFEGGNGTIEISDGCVMSNVRIERNIYASRWLFVRGNGNKFDISIFDVGGTNADWRVFCQGSNNSFTIKAGFALYLLTESGKNNKYDILLYKTPQPVISNLVAVRQSSSLIINNVEQNVSRKTKKEKGQNLVRGIGMTGVTSGTTLLNPHGTVSDLYNISATRILNGTGTGIIPINTTINDVIYCKTDIYIQSVAGEPLQKMAFHGLEKEIYIFDEWMGVFAKSVLATTSEIPFNSYKDNTQTGTGKVAFGLTKISINEMPVDFFENSTTQTETHLDNCFSNSLQLESLSLANISTQITTRKVDNNFKVITHDKQNLLFTSTANVFLKLDKLNNKIYRVDNSTAGVLGGASLKATLKGWSITDFGYTKYIEIEVSRATTSDSWTYTAGGYRFEKGCIFNFANALGSLAGTTLDNMTFEVVYNQVDIVNNKLSSILNISDLQGFIDANTANFDGSIWEKKSGNVASNGGTSAGTIINVNASFYWERKFENVVNVKWFGAVGNGTTNDYPSIANAVTYCTQINSGQGVVLYFPGGTYAISQKIVMPNRVGFQGANGRGTAIVAHSTFADAYMFHSVNGTSSMFGSYLKDFYIDARGKNMTSVVYSQAWQETCGMERVLIQFGGTTLNGFEYSNGYGGAAYLPLKDCEIFSESTNVNAKGIKINQVSSVGGFMINVEGTTIAGSLANPLPVGIYMTNDALITKGYHIEYVVSGVKLAGVSSLSVDTYTGSYNAVTNMVEIETGFTGSINLKNMIPNGTTAYILKDNINSRHILSLEGNLESYSYEKSSFSSNITTDVTGQTGDGTEVALIFGTKNYDYKNEYNPVSGVFNAKRAGKYLFNVAIQLNLPAGSTSVLIYVNTTQGFTEIFRGNAELLRDGSNNVLISGSALMDMAQNDFARVYLNVTGIGAKTVTLKAIKSKFLGSFLYR